MSCVICHMSGVRCQVSGVIFCVIGNWRRVCYQRGLPCLVYYQVSLLYFVYLCWLRWQLWHCDNISVKHINMITGSILCNTKSNWNNLTFLLSIIVCPHCLSLPSHFVDEWTTQKQHLSSFNRHNEDITFEVHLVCLLPFPVFLQCLEVCWPILAAGDSH